MSVHGSWIGIHRVTKIRIQNGQIINNATTVSSHVRIYTAAEESINEILQPRELVVSGNR